MSITTLTATTTPFPLFPCCVRRTVRGFAHLFLHDWAAATAVLGPILAAEPQLSRDLVHLAEQLSDESRLQEV